MIILLRLPAGWVEWTDSGKQTLMQIGYDEHIDKNTDRYILKHWKKYNYASFPTLGIAFATHGVTSAKKNMSKECVAMLS